jgi:hypothetical protein
MVSLVGWNMSSAISFYPVPPVSGAVSLNSLSRRRYGRRIGPIARAFPSDNSVIIVISVNNCQESLFIWLLVKKAGVLKSGRFFPIISGGS